jgi:hypothetical protein
MSYLVTLAACVLLFVWPGLSDEQVFIAEYPYGGSPQQWRPAWDQCLADRRELLPDLFAKGRIAHCRSGWRGGFGNRVYQPPPRWESMVVGSDWIEVTPHPHEEGDLVRFWPWAGACITQ